MRAVAAAAQHAAAECLGRPSRGGSGTFRLTPCPDQSLCGILHTKLGPPESLQVPTPKRAKTLCPARRHAGPLAACKARRPGRSRRGGQVVAPPPGRHRSVSCCPSMLCSNPAALAFPLCRELLDSLTLGRYLATRPPRAVISITAADTVGSMLRRFACAGLVRQLVPHLQQERQVLLSCICLLCADTAAPACTSCATLLPLHRQTGGGAPV